MEQVRFTIRLVERLNSALEDIARQTGHSKNAIVVDACYEYVKHIKEHRAFPLVLEHKKKGECL